jgi:hypothetical protein
LNTLTATDDKAISIRGEANGVWISFNPKSC